ncbi:MAG: hypothetical protein HQL51_04350 [Magnetococcales bacterium]|nr:hypothetical protein [Magnetococcales bacterium]
MKRYLLVFGEGGFTVRDAVTGQMVAFFRDYRYACDYLQGLKGEGDS